jgi:uncharacterized membrane protein
MTDKPEIFFSYAWGEIISNDLLLTKLAKMKQIITHRITLICTAIALILSCIWYYNSQDIEPLISIVSFAGILITGIFFHTQTHEAEVPKENNGNYI